MAVPAVPFVIPGCRFDAVAFEEARLLVSAHSAARRAACPECGRRSRRIHGYYSRAPADLPVSDQAARLRLRVRRFCCDYGPCPRKTFADPLSGLLLPYARRTDRLAATQVRVGLVTGAEPGARLLAWLRMPTSPDTVLRLLHRHPVPEAAVPRVLGVDDWAWRRGKAWGTILVDLERRRPVDLLPDRTSDSLATWLRAHPGIEVVARDRSTEYARGIAEGAPAALQVADRWHLLHNLGEVLDRYLTSVRGRLRKLPGVTDLPGLTSPLPPNQRRTRAEEAASAAARQRRVERYTEARRLHAEEGLNVLQIRRTLGMSRSTVRKYLAADAFPEWGRRPSPARILTPWEGHLRARWNVGVREGLALWREIRALGFTGTSRQVSRWAHQQRTEPHPHTRADYRATCVLPAPDHRGRLPSTRQLAWILSKEAAALSPTDAAVLACIRADPEVATVHALAWRYTQMVREKRAGDLVGWLDACTQSGVGPLVSFGRGLQRDYAAVRAALEEPWSSGQAEGQINRLKTLKRQMYGRAGFDLLRRRVLCAA